jgi:hypothetical protein
MKELKLNNTDFALFKKIVSTDYDFKKEPDSVYTIKGDDVFFDKVLDELSNYLVENGLKGNDEINTVGEKVETLIDYVSEVYYSSE